MIAAADSSRQYIRAVRALPDINQQKYIVDQVATATITHVNIFVLASRGFLEKTTMPSAILAAALIKAEIKPRYITSRLE